MNLRQNGLVLILATALLGIAEQWAGQPLMGNIWAAPLAVLVLGLGYEQWVCARAALTLRIRAPAPWHLGESGRVQWTVCHGLQRPLTVMFAPRPPAGVDVQTDIRIVEVAALEGALIELPAVARRLGEVRWPAQPMRIAGPLGLAWWSRRIADDTPASVVPAVLDLSESASGVVLGGARVSHTLGSGAQVEQLRDYRPGDPLRVIDWRATARRRELVSRDFVEEQHLAVVVALDVGRASRIRCGALDRLGHYVNAAARLAQYVVAQEDRIGLVLFGDQPLAVLRPARGHAAVMRVRELLARVQAQSTDSNVMHAASQVLRRVHQRSLVVLMTDIEDAGSEGSLAGALRLLQPRHLPFVMGLSALNPAVIADQAPREWLDPWLSLAAGHVLSQRDRAIRALAATGAQVVLSTPAQFEHTLFQRYALFRQQRRI